jgi:1-hydroxycarotenoid 3,4-desaturase
MLHIKPYSTLWQALSRQFKDPRLRQLFGRYATYAGSSPFMSPATLMLIAHVEQEGVWLVGGGMHRLAAALADVATRLGADIRYGKEVAEVLTKGGRAHGVRLRDSDQSPITADAVVLNTDVSALGAGLLGAGSRHAAPATQRKDRSLSALTWNLVAETDGFPLMRHSVFFSSDYPAEFKSIFERRRLPEEPTVYICAQDRQAQLSHTGAGPDIGPERLLLLVNAPADGDRRRFEPGELEACRTRTLSLLRHCGLRIALRDDAAVATSPNEFEQLFPATGGALYGRASHGWQASFSRPGARTRLKGLYLAGGSTHPGAGVPMAALSGRQAALAVKKDLLSK